MNRNHRHPYNAASILRDLVRDRQLVVLNDELLFEGGQASNSRLKVGQQVTVTRTKSLLAERFRLQGPNGGPLDAARIRCEDSNIKRDSRRKCTLLSGPGED